MDRRRADRRDVPHRADPLATAADGLPAGPPVAREDLSAHRGLRGRAPHAGRAHGRGRRGDPERRLHPGFHRRRARRALDGHPRGAHDRVPRPTRRGAQGPSRAPRRGAARARGDPRCAVPRRGARRHGSRRSTRATRREGRRSGRVPRRHLRRGQGPAALVRRHLLRAADRRRKLRHRARRGDECRRRGRRERPGCVLPGARRRCRGRALHHRRQRGPCEHADPGPARSRAAHSGTPGHMPGGRRSTTGRWSPTRC